MNKVCCVPGCARSRAALHKFPNPATHSEQFGKWISNIGCGDNHNSDFIYNNRKICQKHFGDVRVYYKSKLNVHAVPTLFLPGKLNSDGTYQALPVGYRITKPAPIPLKLNKISSTNPRRPVTIEPEYTEIEYVEPELIETEYIDHTICDELATETADDDMNDSPPIAFEFVSTTDPPAPKPFRADVGDIVSTELGNNNTHTQAARAKQTCIEDTYATDVASTDVYSSTDASTQTVGYVLTSIQRFHLENELKELRKLLRNSKKCISKKTCRIRVLTERLNNNRITVRKNITQTVLERVTRNMTPAARVFTKMQFTQTSRRKNGRRFTTEEKNLSLSIYKSSPTGYAVLSNFFTLPCVRSIKQYWSEVENQVEASEELNSNSPLDHTASDQGEDGNESPAIHADDVDTFAPQMDFNLIDHILVGDDDDNVPQNPLIAFINDETVVTKVNSNHLDNTIGDDCLKLTQPQPISCNRNVKTLPNKVNSNNLVHTTGDQNVNLTQIPVKRLMNVKKLPNKVNPNNLVHTTGDQNVNLTQIPVKRLINVKKLPNKVTSNNLVHTTGDQNVNLTQIPVKRLINVKKLPNKVNSNNLVHTTGDQNVNLTQIPAKRLKMVKLLGANVNLGQATGVASKSCVPGDQYINLTPVPMKRLKSVKKTFVPRVHSTIEIGLSSQTLDIQDNSYQQTLDKALAGLTYDMPELE